MIKLIFIKTDYTTKQKQRHLIVARWKFRFRSISGDHTEPFGET